MNTPNPVSSGVTTTATPWYRSRIMQGILTVVVTQVAAKVQSHYHVDLSVMGISIDDAVQGAMNAISALAAYWALHARVASNVPIPPVITLTAAKAAELNGTPPKT